MLTIIKVSRECEYVDDFIPSYTEILTRGKSVP